MKAVILAAGAGNRMRRLPDDPHKTLFEIGGKSIIGRIIDGLLANGISHGYIVTGYRADELEHYVTSEFAGFRCTFIRNERYATTNNIYSMSLALEHADCDDGLLLIECDLIYEPKVLAKLIACPYPNAALVDRYRIGLDGTVVAVSAGNVITQVIPPSAQGEMFDFSDKFKTLNIYKFSAQFCRGPFRKLLTYYTHNLDANCYYEVILGVLVTLQQIEIHAEIIEGEVWAEVDDPNDLRAAEFAFAPAKRRQWLESSWGGYWSVPITDFAFIRNMYFPTPSMLSQLRAFLSELVLNYGSAQTILDRKLSYFLRCQPNHVHLLNGASQIFPIMRSWFRPERVLLPEPTFGEYNRCFPLASRYADRGSVALTGIDRFAATAELIIVVNPNNPTGTTVTTDAIAELATRHNGKLILVDESFIEFSGQPSIIPWIEATDAQNVIVVKSLSKSLGVPGLRLGYIFTTNQPLSERILAELPVWNTNSIAEFFLEMLLKYPDELQSSVERTIGDRARFVIELGDLQVVDQVYESGANFILVALSIPHALAEKLADVLLVNRNILVKDISSKFSDGRAYWRLAVRTPPGNTALCSAIESGFCQLDLVN